MIPLTAKQRELLDYLRLCERTPSFEEMMKALGLRSKSGVHRLVAALEERGYIRRIPNKARCIELVENPTLRSISDAPLSMIVTEANRRGFFVGRIRRDADGVKRFFEQAA